MMNVAASYNGVINTSSGGFNFATGGYGMFMNLTAQVNNFYGVQIQNSSSIFSIQSVQNNAMGLYIWNAAFNIVLDYNGFQNGINPVSSGSPFGSGPMGQTDVMIGTISGCSLTIVSDTTAHGGTATNDCIQFFGGNDGSAAPVNLYLQVALNSARNAILSVTQGSTGSVTFDGTTYIAGSLKAVSETYGTNTTNGGSVTGVPITKVVGLSPAKSSVTAGTSPYTFPLLPYDAVYVITTVGGMTALTLDGQALFNATFSVGQQIYVAANHTLIATWAATAPVFEILPI